MEDCDCARGPSISVLIPSLTSALLGLATPSNHTPFCSGRIHHSAVYSTHSNSVYVFGGVDITGVMCPRGMVRIYPPQGSGSGSGMWEGPGVWSEGSLVGVVGGIGMGPSARYQHAATLTSVSVYSELPLIRTPEMWPPLYSGHSEKSQSMLYSTNSPLK